MHYPKTLVKLGAISLLATSAQTHAQLNVTVFPDNGSAIGEIPSELTTPNPPANGFNMQRVILRYDADTDTLDVRMKFDGVAGDVDGDGDPNTGTGDVANFGPGENFGLTIDSNCDGFSNLIIGLPTDAQLKGVANEPLFVRFGPSGPSGFPNGDGFDGATFPGVTAALVHPPSSSDPDILIRISGWSNIGRNHEQFIAVFFADSQGDGGDEDVELGNVNLNFSGRASFRARDFDFDVGLSPQSVSPNTGWDLSTTNYFYDPNTDVMRVVQRFNGVAGDADGDGNPDSATAPLPSNIDLPNLGGSESIAIAFDFDEDGTFDTVVGVPGESNSPNFHNDFIDPGDLSIPVADFDGSVTNLGTSFGNPTNTGATASLEHNPSAAQPDFIVNIQNWSELTITPFQFGYRAFAGSFADQGFGEDNQENSIALEGRFDERTERFTDPVDVGIPPQHPFLSGWDFTSLDFNYDPREDKLRILMDFAGIAGDADGDGDPGVQTASAGGVDAPNIGNGETITVMLDLDSDGSEDIIIGVPRDESLNVSTLRLRISEFNPDADLGLNFGTDDSSGATALATANPSAENPDFEITVFGWSLLDTQEPSLFGLRAFAGSFVDAGFGEDNIPDPGDPPLVTKLGFPLTIDQIERDVTNGTTTISFQGNESTEHQIVDISSLDPTNTTLVNNLTDLLDGQMETDGTIETDFTGNAAIQFNDPLGNLRRFFRVEEAAPES